MTKKSWIFYDTLSCLSASLYLNQRSLIHPEKGCKYVQFFLKAQFNSGFVDDSSVWQFR